MTERYRAAPSKHEYATWNVFDSTRRNMFGDMWIEVPLLSEEAAKICAEQLNAMHKEYDNGSNATV